VCFCNEIESHDFLDLYVFWQSQQKFIALVFTVDNFNHKFHYKIEVYGKLAHVFIGYNIMNFFNWKYKNLCTDIDYIPISSSKIIRL